MSEQAGGREAEKGGGPTGGDAEEGGGPTACGGRPCPICEEPLYHRHCKYVCPQHGVVYDCSDTFY